MDPHQPYFGEGGNQAYNYQHNAANQRIVPASVPPHSMARVNSQPDYINPESPLYPQVQYQISNVPNYPPPFFCENPNINYHMQMQVQHQRTTLETKSFIKSMEFQKEQEISKQYAMKLEMLKLSMQANIPGNMIPQLFHNDQNIIQGDRPATPEQYSRVSYQDHRIKELPHPNSDVVYIDPSRSIRLRTFSDNNETEDFEKTPENVTNNIYDQAENYNTVPQLHFKNQSKRTNSPFKIGEAGVKALNSKNINMNEAQERNDSRISSINEISGRNSRVTSTNENDPMMFKPKMHSFNTGILEDNRSTNSSTLHFKGASVKHSPDSSQTKSFVKSHKRYNSMPSTLKPSADISPLKQTAHKRTRSVFYGHNKSDSQTSEALLELSQNNAFKKTTHNMHSRKRSYDYGTHQAASIDLNAIKRQKNIYTENIKSHEDLEYTVNNKFQFGNTTENEISLKKYEMDNTPEHETTIDEEDKDDNIVMKKVQFNEDLIVDTDETENNESNNNGKRKNTLKSILN